MVLVAYYRSSGSTSPLDVDEEKIKPQILCRQITQIAYNITDTP